MPQHRPTQHIMLAADAASRGDLAALTSAHAKHSVLLAETTENAARSGSLPCMQFCHENGAPWHIKTTYIALLCPDIACFKYATRHGAPRDGGVIPYCLHKLRGWDSQKWEDILQFAVNARYPFRPYLVKIELDFMANLYKNGYPRSTKKSRAKCALKDKESDIKLVVAVWGKLHKIRVIQRAWRAWCERRWIPGSGSGYKRALISFTSHGKSLSPLT